MGFMSTSFRNFPSRGSLIFGAWLTQSATSSLHTHQRKLIMAEPGNLFLFIYGLFNDAVSSLDDIASSDRMINEQ
jgi:hypothetical protein